LSLFLFIYFSSFFLLFLLDCLCIILLNNLFVFLERLAFLRSVDLDFLFNFALFMFFFNLLIVYIVVLDQYMHLHAKLTRECFRTIFAFECEQFRILQLSLLLLT